MTRRLLPPLTQEQFAQLRADAKDVTAAAARKNMDVSRSEIHHERSVAERHFELGCWLHYYAKRVGSTGPDGTKDRIDCVRRIWDAGIESPVYDFHTVFDFGEREFDTCFEMNDNDKVAKGLIQSALARPASAFAAIVRNWGWMPRPALDPLLARLRATGEAAVEARDEDFARPRERE